MRRATIALLLGALLAGGCCRRGREINPQSATTRPGTLRVYTLGDSNGAAPQGWPVQLDRALSAALAPREAVVYNDSVPARAIGFQKQGPQTTALAVAAASIGAARAELGGPIDECVVALGTNDAQNCWAEEGKTLDDIAGNLDALLAKIKAAVPDGDRTPRITVLAPPPLGAIMDADAEPTTAPAGRHQDKWRGARPRLEGLVARMRAVAERHGARFVNAYEQMEPRAAELVGPDGVHLTAAGHEALGRLAAEAILGQTPEAP